MDIERAKIFRPVAEPRVIEGAYSEDQHRRLLEVVRNNGPWSLIISQHFKSAEELIAPPSGSLPEGVEPTLDMFLSPVFRGYYSYGGVCSQPEIEDCFYNPKFLQLVRDYWGAKYAEPDSMLFNIQGPCGGAGNPHVDATRFRGLTLLAGWPPRAAKTDSRPHVGARRGGGERDDVPHCPEQRAERFAQARGSGFRVGDGSRSAGCRWLAHSYR